MGIVHSLPVVLPSASAAFTPTVALGTTVIAVPGIRNTESVGVLIDKIVVNVMRTGAALPGTFLPSIELRWHNVLITDSFVCLGAVAWPQNRAHEANGIYSIKLAKPFYLAPGDYIDVAYRADFFAAVGNTGVTMVAAGIGHQCLVPPANDQWIPYLCDYIGPVYTPGGGGAIADQSDPNDLGNPHNTPLLVERMIGRILTGTNSFLDNDPDPFWQNFSMRVSDHRDNFWVAQPTPLPLVCNVVDRSWILNHTMEPKGFLRVEFEGVATAASRGAPNGRAVVGLVGYRRIAT